jgi:hypothetical protein
MRRGIVRPVLAAAIIAATFVPAAQAHDASVLPQPAGTAAQRHALQAMKRTAGGRVASHFAPETSAYNFVRALGTGVIARDDSRADAAARAFGFLQRYGAVLGMSLAERASLAAGSTGAVLRVHSVDRDQIGKTHVRLDQMYRGLPVFGAQVVVHMNRRGITAVNGTFVPAIATGSSPRLSRATAATKALAVAAKATRHPAVLGTR